MKTFQNSIEEGTADPYAAISRRYLKIPCSCMTPNLRRLTELDGMVERFRPDVVVDIILHGCHAYNVESHKVKEHLKKRHGMPYLKIETDYSQGDLEQILTRVEATLDVFRQ